MAIKKKLVVRIPKIKKPSKRRLLKTALFVFLFGSVIVFGTMLGAYVAILQNLPSIFQLEEFEPSIITYINADDSQVIGEYAIEKRIEVSFEDIPEIMKFGVITTPALVVNSEVMVAGKVPSVEEIKRMLS